MPDRNRNRLTMGTKLMMTATLAILLATMLFFHLAGIRPEQDTQSVIEQLRAQGMLDGQTLPEQTPPAFSGALQETAEKTPSVQSQPLERKTEGFTLAAGGTVCVPRSIREYALEGSRYDFSTIFLGLGNRLSDADISICTLDSMTDDRSAYDNVNAPSSLLDALASVGMDLVSLGTEHALDRGYESLDVTLSELNTRGLMGVGIRQDGKGLPGIVLQIGGIRTAILAYTYGLSDEGAAVTQNDRLGEIALLSDEEQMIRDVRTARADGAQAVILMVHWGIKNRSTPPESLKKLAQRLAEAGADLILGTHPGMVQEAERLRVQRSDGLTYETIVAYSLGSLLTDARTQESAAGVIVRFAFEKDEKTGALTVRALPVIPTYAARQDEDGVVSWRIVEADSEASTAVLGEQGRAAAAGAARLVRSMFSGLEKGE